MAIFFWFNTLDRHNFANIEFLDDKQVVKVVCGHFNSAALTRTGELYVWGRGLYGSEDVIVTRPKQIQIDKLVDISLRYKHILAITADNRVYSWGYNKYGHCGVHSNSEWINEPTLVPSLTDCDILQIKAGLSAGGCHSLIKCKAASL